MPPPSATAVRGEPEPVVLLRPIRSRPDPRAWVQITLGIVVLGLMCAISVLPGDRESDRAVGSNPGVQALLHTLADIRFALRAYRTDHGAWPGCEIDPRAEPLDSRAFVQRLCAATTQEGRLADDPWIGLGPYLDWPFPRNPINGLSRVTVLLPREPWPAEADGQSGWLYRPDTGELRANSPGRLPGTDTRWYDL